MAEYYKAIATDELQSGQMKRVNVAGREIVIAREEDNFYAADNKCPHMGGNLSKGSLDGHVITCPVHKSKFDLKTGSVIQWTDFGGLTLAIGKAFKKPRALQIYPVKIDKKDVMVQI